MGGRTMFIETQSANGKGLLNANMPYGQSLDQAQQAVQVPISGQLSDLLLEFRGVRQGITTIRERLYGVFPVEGSTKDPSAKRAVVDEISDLQSEVRSALDSLNVILGRL